MERYTRKNPSQIFVIKPCPSEKHLHSCEIDDNTFSNKNGRTYHGYKREKYVFPNDEKELDRMDMMHSVWRMQRDGKLYSCPLPNTAEEVLDVGTGSGIWAMEMADENPHLQIVGTDLSPTQPPWVPPNCRFEIDDFSEEW